MTHRIDDGFFHLHGFTEPSLYIVICFSIPSGKESTAKLSVDENVDNLALRVTG